MKYHQTVLMFAAAVLWTGCDSTQDEAQLPYSPNTAESSEATPADPAVADARGIADATLVRQKETVMATVEQSLTEIDARIESVTSSVQQLNPSDQPQVQSAIATLRDQRQELDSMLDRMRDATGQDWQELQRNFHTARQAILNALEETEELLKG